jgi:hypothetical protein
VRRVRARLRDEARYDTSALLAQIDRDIADARGRARVDRRRGACAPRRVRGGNRCDDQGVLLCER